MIFIKLKKKKKNFLIVIFFLSKMTTNFTSVMQKFDSKLQALQKQMLSQMEDFEKKQKNLLNLEKDFEKNLEQENEKFSKKMQERREKIQAESKVEETITKHTTEFKRKSSLKFPQQTTSPEYKPIVMSQQRQSSSRGMRKPVKNEEMLESVTKTTPKKLVLNLIKGEFAIDLDVLGKMDPYCKFLINGKTIKSKVCEDQGKTPVWNQNFEIFEDFNKGLEISFKVLDKNLGKEDKIIGEGVVKMEVSLLKSQEIWIDITKNQKNTGKILFRLEFL